MHTLLCKQRDNISKNIPPVSFQKGYYHGVGLIISNFKKLCLQVFSTVFESKLNILKMRKKQRNSLENHFPKKLCLSELRVTDSRHSVSARVIPCVSDYLHPHSLEKLHTNSSLSLSLCFPARPCHGDYVDKCE